MDASLVTRLPRSLHATAKCRQGVILAVAILNVGGRESLRVKGTLLHDHIFITQDS